MLGVRQWRSVALRHEVFSVSRQHRLGHIFMFYPWQADVLIHRLWNNVYDRWITSNLPYKWRWIASTTSGCNSSLRRIFHRNSSGVRTPTWNSAWTTKERRRQQETAEHRLQQRRKSRQQKTENRLEEHTRLQYQRHRGWKSLPWNI